MSLPTPHIILTYGTDAETIISSPNITIQPQVLGFGPRGPKGDTGNAVDATTTSKGVVQLAGDLAGTAAAPTVPGLAGKEPAITPGTTSQFWRGDKTWQLLPPETYTQTFTNQTSVVIDHNLNKYPAVTVMDSANDMVLGEVNYTSLNQAIISFSASFTGRVACN